MVWNIFYFFHILGIIIPIDFHIFQRGRLNHQPDNLYNLYNLYSYHPLELGGTPCSQPSDLPIGNLAMAPADPGAAANALLSQAHGVAAANPRGAWGASFQIHTPFSFWCFYVSFLKHRTIFGQFYGISFDSGFDAIWCYLNSVLSVELSEHSLGAQLLNHDLVTACKICGVTYIYIYIWGQ